MKLSIIFTLNKTRERERERERNFANFYIFRKREIADLKYFDSYVFHKIFTHRFREWFLCRGHM